MAIYSCRPASRLAAAGYLSWLEVASWSPDKTTAPLATVQRALRR
ncbi:hypothetical protein ABZT03_44450 [Streptomyces sp. NPDC005574]